MICTAIRVSIFNPDYATGVFILIFLPLRSLRLCVKLLFHAKHLSPSPACRYRDETSFDSEKMQSSPRSRKEKKEQMQITISKCAIWLQRYFADLPGGALRCV